MARIRTIKPELPSDPSLAKCSRDARLAFTYLITQSDDYGYVPAAPRQIVGLLFPHDDDLTPSDIGRWINELVAVGLCAWAWTTDGLPLIHLVGWEDHQRIDNRRRAVLSARLAPDQNHPPAYGIAKTGDCDIRHAETRGGFAAVRGENPLEPPTSDLGPRTSDQRPPLAERQNTPPIRKPRESRPKGPATWLTPIGAAWEAENGAGSFPYPQAAREMKPLVAAGHSAELIARRLAWYLRVRGLDTTDPDPAVIARTRFTPNLRDFRLRFARFDPERAA